MSHDPLSRRSLLKAGALAAAALSLGNAIRGQEKQNDNPAGQKTKFQVACMTLPYSQYPLARALEGIKKAGYQFVAWGTTHKEEGEEKPVPVMPPDAPAEKAKELGQKCRDAGLTPVMMFSTIYPEQWRSRTLRRV